jgi:hypothetical protein
MKVLLTMTSSPLIDIITIIARSDVINESFQKKKNSNSNERVWTLVYTFWRRYGAIVCSADIALNDKLWQVLDDVDGSDHLPIMISIQSLNAPTNIPVPIFDLTRHITSSNYTESVLESLHNSPGNI